MERETLTVSSESATPVDSLANDYYQVLAEKEETTFTFLSLDHTARIVYNSDNDFRGIELELRNAPVKYVRVDEYKLVKLIRNYPGSLPIDWVAALSSPVVVHYEEGKTASIEVQDPEFELTLPVNVGNPVWDNLRGSRLGEPRELVTLAPITTFANVLREYTTLDEAPYIPATVSVDEYNTTNKTATLTIAPAIECDEATRTALTLTDQFSLSHTFIEGLIERSGLANDIEDVPVYLTTAIHTSHFSYTFGDSRRSDSHLTKLFRSGLAVAFADEVEEHIYWDSSRLGKFARRPPANRAVNAVAHVIPLCILAAIFAGVFPLSGVLAPAGILVMSVLVALVLFSATHAY